MLVECSHCVLHDMDDRAVSAPAAALIRDEHFSISEQIDEISVAVGSHMEVRHVSFERLFAARKAEDSHKGRVAHQNPAVRSGHEVPGQVVLEELPVELLAPLQILLSLPSPGEVPIDDGDPVAFDRDRGGGDIDPMDDIRLLYDAHLDVFNEPSFLQGSDGGKFLFGHKGAVGPDDPPLTADACFAPMIF
ncbi:MAG: hypothetical protein BWZ01_02900 [Deltaproteobacteria bacterium ADurb.BinA179]|nr:MAG: hypothetical protein BWZ01_02900 [Deltaproteobacteria bacterium ADurb.BinA179]